MQAAAAAAEFLPLADYPDDTAQEYTWAQLMERYPPCAGLAPDGRTPLEIIKQSEKAFVVRLGPAYVVKVLDETHFSMQNANEARVMAALQRELEPHVAALFVRGHGYLWCTEGVPRARFHQDTDWWACVFMDYVPNEFGTLPDDPDVFANAYFELLAGLYYARRRLRFAHNDVQPSNLRWRTPASPQQARVYAIHSEEEDADFELRIDAAHAHVQPVFIDFGNSAAAIGGVRYDDDTQATRATERFWYKSDLYHVTTAFLGEADRPGGRRVDAAHRAIMLAVVEEHKGAAWLTRQFVRPASDSAANTRNIVKVLRAWVNAKAARPRCIECRLLAVRIQERTDARAFCGRDCQRAFHRHIQRGVKIQ